MSGPESNRLITTDASRRIDRRPPSSDAQRGDQCHQDRIEHEALGQVDHLGGARRMQPQDDAARRRGARRNRASAARRAGRGGMAAGPAGRTRPGAARRTAARPSRRDIPRPASAAARSRRSGRNAGMGVRPAPRWGRSIASASAAQPSPMLRSGRARTCSPGRVSGTYSGVPSGRRPMPSPSDPMRSMRMTAGGGGVSGSMLAFVGCEERPGRCPGPAKGRRPLEPIKGFGGEGLPGGLNDLVAPLPQTPY